MFNNKNPRLFFLMPQNCRGIRCTGKGGLYLFNALRVLHQMEVNVEEGRNSSFDILNNSEDYIINNLEIIYPVLLEYFSSSVENDSITVRSLDIAFGPCLTLFKSEDLEDKLFKHAFPFAEKYLVQIFRNDLDSVAESNIHSLDGCLEILARLSSGTEYFLAGLSKLRVGKAKSLLLCTSVILLESYQFCVKYRGNKTIQFKTVTESLSLLVLKAQALHCMLFQLLSKVEICDVADEVDILNEILTLTYKSGMVLINLNVKAMAEIWKGYISFVEKYSELLKTTHEVSVPIECLTMNLINNLKSFTSDVINNQSLDKTVKIFCFILKVIIKLVQKFNGFLGSCHKSLLDLLITLSRLSDHYSNILNSQTDNANQFQQLVIGIDPLLSFLINDEDFAQIYATESRDITLNMGKRFEFLLLTCQIITKLTLADAKTRSKWFNTDDNILDYMFQIVILCSLEFSSDYKFPGILIPGKAKRLTDCFEYLLTHISAFLLMSTSQEFVLAEKTLLKYILQPNPWCSLLATDIWCLLARFGDAEICFKQLMNLCRLLIQFENWPSIPEKLFLESAIARLFPIMSQKHKDLFVEVYPLEKHGYLWQIFRVHNLSTHFFNITNSSICNFTVSQTNRFLTEENFEDTDFEKMESALFGLNAKCKDLNEVLEDNLVKLWNVDWRNFISNPLSRRYLKSISAATSAIICCMSPKNMFSVLQEINTLFMVTEQSFMLYCLENLDELGRAFIPKGNLQYNIIHLISLLFKQCLTSHNILVKTRSTEVFVSFASVTRHTQIITESYNNDSALQTRIKNYLQRKHQGADKDRTVIKYLNKIEVIKYEHVCDVGKELQLYEYDTGEPPLKQIRLDRSEWENKELDNMISSLKNEAFKISDNSEKLTLLQKKELSAVTDLLLQLVG